MSFTDHYTMKTVDLFPGSLRGYRAWRIDDMWLNPLLMSVNIRSDRILPSSSYYNRYPWQPGINRAECFAILDNGEFTRDKSFKPQCFCGFYATHQLESLGKEVLYSNNVRNHSRPMVLGSIRASGCVVLGKYGLRAEHAEVESLCLEPIKKAGLGIAPMLSDIARLYGVPLYVTVDDFLSACPPENIDQLIAEEVS